MAKYPQAATYWPKTGVDEFNKTILGESDEICVRWQEKIDRFKNEDGKELISKAIVYTDKEVFTDDYLFLGESNEVDPTVDDRAYIIKMVEKSINLTNTKSFYKVWL